MVWNKWQAQFKWMYVKRIEEKSNLCKRRDGEKIGFAKERI